MYFYFVAVVHVVAKIDGHFLGMLQHKHFSWHNVHKYEFKYTVYTRIEFDRTNHHQREESTAANEQQVKAVKKKWPQ